MSSVPGLLLVAALCGTETRPEAFITVPAERTGLSAVMTDLTVGWDGDDSAVLKSQLPGHDAAMSLLHSRALITAFWGETEQ